METKAAQRNLEPLDGQLLKKYDALEETLRRCKASEDQNLYTHVIEVMNMLVVHYPNDALNKLEEVSYLIKCGDDERLQEFLRVNAKKNYAVPSSQSTAKATNQFIDHARRLLGSAKGEDDEENESPAIGFVPDIVADNLSLIHI